MSDPGKAIEAFGEDRLRASSRSDESAGPAKQDAPNTLITPSLLSDSREAIVRIIDPERFAVYEWSKSNGPELFDISDLFAKADEILSLPQTGVEAEALEAARAALESIYHYTFDHGVPDSDIRRLVRSEASDALPPIVAALTPKVIDRDIEGDGAFYARHSKAAAIAAGDYFPVTPQEVHENTIERCAKVAESCDQPLWRNSYSDAREDIAAAIRALASPSLHGDEK